MKDHVLYVRMSEPEMDRIDDAVKRESERRGSEVSRSQLVREIVARALKASR